MSSLFWTPVYPQFFEQQYGVQIRKDQAVAASTPEDLHLPERESR